MNTKINAIEEKIKNKKEFQKFIWNFQEVGEAKYKQIQSIEKDLELCWIVCTAYHMKQIKELRCVLSEFTDSVFKTITTHKKYRVTRGDKGIRRKK